MISLRLFPAILSLLVLGAHFLRAGNVVALALVFAALGVLAVRRPLAARTAQAALVLGAFEWVRTLVSLALLRAAMGEPMLRMILILAGVATFTLLSALAFQSDLLRRWYAFPRASDQGGV